MTKHIDLRVIWGNASRESYNLEAAKKPDEAKVVLDAAYRAIATAYAALSINKCDPFAFGKMLNDLRTGIEKPVDQDTYGDEIGVIHWIEERWPAEDAWVARIATKAEGRPYALAA